MDCVEEEPVAVQKEADDGDDDEDDDKDELIDRNGGASRNGNQARAEQPDDDIYEVEISVSNIHCSLVFPTHCRPSLTHCRPSLSHSL